MKVFNLVEELEKERKKNKELEERIQFVVYKNNELLDRILKTIEYIEKYKTEDYCDGMSAKQLLDILKGEE